MHVSWGSTGSTGVLQSCSHYLQLHTSICVIPLHLCLQVSHPVLASQELLLQMLLLFNLCLLAL